MEARETKKRTQVDDIDRSKYDFRFEDADAERLDAGLTPDIVREISERKGEPAWMLEHRLHSLEVYNRLRVPDWGPSIAGLDMDNIVTYVKPNTDQQSDWESVPDNIKETFDRLGIPQAERSYLAGVGAQYDSELVYHSMQESAAKMGIVYTGIEEALHGEYAELIRQKFMTLIPPTDHKFAALHGAVWSGGSFVYVPRGVKLDYPLQSYFRLNAKGAGPVRAHAHHRRGRCRPALHRRLQRPEIQRGQPACRCRGAVRGQARAPALLDHRELVEEHVQPEHQAVPLR